MIELFGFQEGPQGFVQYGINPPIDYLHLAAICGREAGKTAGGALRTIAYLAHYPGAHGMITAPTNDKLRDTVRPTLETFFKKSGLRPGRNYEYNKTERQYYVDTGRGEISYLYLRTTEEPENLPGPTLAFFWMDEARISPEQAYQELGPTLRQEGYPHHCWITTTSQGPHHWITKVFAPDYYIPKVDEEITEVRPVGPNRWVRPSPDDDVPDMTYVMYQARTADNPHGGRAVDAKLAADYGRNSRIYRQEALAEFVTMEGLVYPSWDSKYHIVPLEAWPVQPRDMWHVVAGVDFGWRNPSAIMVEGIDKKMRRYIMDEHYGTQMDEQDIVFGCKRMYEKYHVEMFLCDAADPRLIRAIQFAGLPAIKATKSVGSAWNPASGIGLCTQALNYKPDGGQGFFVAPHCQAFIREIESFVHNLPKEGKNLDEKPRQFGNHAADAWRYSELAIQRFWGRGVVEGKSLRVKFG